MTTESPRNTFTKIIELFKLIFEYYMEELHDDFVKIAIVSVSLFITAVLWTRDQGAKYGKNKHLYLQRFNEFRDQAGSHFVLGF